MPRNPVERLRGKLGFTAMCGPHNTLFLAPLDQALHPSAADDRALSMGSVGRPSPDARVRAPAALAQVLRSWWLPALQDRRGLFITRSRFSVLPIGQAIAEADLLSMSDASGSWGRLHHGCLRPRVRRSS